MLRAFLALAMLVGYYLVAFGLTLASLCALLGVFWLNTKGPVLWLAYILPVVTGIVSAGMGVAVLFERDPEESADLPGVQIRPAKQPALFAFVNDLSSAMGTPPPDAICLVPGPEVGVTETRKSVGAGRQRVLVLGYLALQVTDRAELRAVLAHELGHTIAGDVALAPLVHRSYRALRRSLELLTSGHRATDMRVLHMAYELVASSLRAYTRLALRVSRTVARQQEIEADRQAVAHGGKRAFLGALERLTREGAIYALFEETEITPLVMAKTWPVGFWDGYRDFSDAVRVKVESTLAARAPDPYDTHPTLAERRALAENLPEPGSVPDDRAPALGLLVNHQRVWERIESHVRPQHDVQLVAWSEVAHVRAKNVDGIASHAAAQLRGVLGEASWIEIARRGAACLAKEGATRLVLSLDPSLAGVEGEEWNDVAPEAFELGFGAIVAMALVVNRGGTFRHRFGELLAVTVGDMLLDPWVLAHEAMGSPEGLARLLSALEGPTSSESGPKPSTGLTAPAPA